MMIKMKFLSLDQNTVKSPNGNLTILHPFSVTFIGYLWISGCISNFFYKSTKLYMDHLICPANSPLDPTRVSDQTFGCFSMFLNLPFNWNIMVVQLFLSLDLHCGMPFPGKFDCVSLSTVLRVILKLIHSTKLLLDFWTSSLAWDAIQLFQLFLWILLGFFSRLIAIILRYCLFLLLYHLYLCIFFMINCKESDYFMYDPIEYICFYVKRWRTVWFGAV